MVNTGESDWNCRSNYLEAVEDKEEGVLLKRKRRKVYICNVSIKTSKY